MNKKLLHGLLIIPVASALIFVGACENMRGAQHRDKRTHRVIAERGTGEGGVVQETIIEEVPAEEQKTLFSDIPLPPKFKLDRTQSVAFEAGRMKAGTLTYEGYAGLEDVVSFYKIEMVPYEWKLSSIIEKSDVIMFFGKEGWSCLIQATPSKFKKIRLTISLGPKPTE